MTSGVYARTSQEVRACVGKHRKFHQCPRAKFKLGEGQKMRGLAKNQGQLKKSVLFCVNFSESGFCRTSSPPQLELSGLTKNDRLPVRGGLERWEFDGTIGTWHHKQQKWCASVPLGLERILVGRWRNLKDVGDEILPRLKGGVKWDMKKTGSTAPKIWTKLTEGEEKHPFRSSLIRSFTGVFYGLKKEVFHAAFKADDT